jgi:DNA (cytosine-5)-methyltransferase 1
MNMKAAAEFFAGIGLVRMALERAGWSVSLANDIDPAKETMYRDFFGGEHFIPGDIRNIEPEMVPNIGLATASFPCIDLSLAGNRDGLNGAHSSAYWQFHRIIEGMQDRRPPFVLLENVVGLLSSKGGEDLRSIVASLGKLGYACDLLMVDAVHFVSQSRPRLFVVGSQHRPRVSEHVLENGVHEARPRQVVQFIRKHPDLSWAHIALPPLPKKHNRLERLLERLEEDAPEWWNKGRRAHMLQQMSPRHKRLLRELVQSKRTRFATVYKRVRPLGCRAEVRADGVAGCLRTPRGGSSRQFVIQAGRGRWRVRNMTAREYARLQGVDDSFPINVPYNKALFGFGDAVCVPAIEWVIRNCLSDGREKAASI